MHFSFFFIFLVHKCFSSLKDLVCFIREFLLSIIICDIRHDRIDTITMTICLQTIPPCADLEGWVRCPGPHPREITVYSIYIEKLSQKYASDSSNFGKYNYPSDPPPPPGGKNFWIRAVWNTWSPFDSSWLETNSP